MKKSISLILAIMLFSVVSVTAFATGIATPKTTASNDVGGIKVYWNKVDDAVKYNIYRRVGGSSSWVYVGTTTDTKIIDKGVSNGKYYAYSVRAYNAQGTYSAYNKNLTYTTKCVATPKLTSLVNDTNGLKLTWGAVSGASYRVYRRGAGSTSWTYLGTTNSTTFTDSKAKSGAYWRYTVRAVSSGYYSGFDTDGLYTIRLANPYSIKASQVQNAVNVTWAKINGATGYRVYRRSAGQTSWVYLGATTSNTFKDTKIGYGANYYRYTVRATRGNVYSGFYTDGAVVRCVAFEPITDPLVAVKMYENYDNFGICCEMTEIYSEELEKFVPDDIKNYHHGDWYSFYWILCDTCKTNEDLKNHARYCIDFNSPNLKNMESLMHSDDVIFQYNGETYFIYASFKGTLYYDYDSAEINWVDNNTAEVIIDYKDFESASVFTIKRIDGTLKVVDVESMYSYYN